MTIQYKELIDPGTYEASVILGRRSHFLCHLWRTTFQPHNFWNYSLGGSSPISKRITLIYKPFRPFGRGTTLLRGLINHGYQPLTSPGMILQARCSNLQRLWSFGRNKILAKLGSYSINFHSTMELEKPGNVSIGKTLCDTLGWLLGISFCHWLPWWKKHLGYRKINDM